MSAFSSVMTSILIAAASAIFAFSLNFVAIPSSPAAWHTQ
jgi:hypothetical protein